MPSATANQSLIDNVHNQKSPATLKHFINGEFVDSVDGGSFESINPATGKPIAYVSLGLLSDIDAAVAAAKDAYETGPWGQMTLKERCAILSRIGDLLEENLDAFALAETMDTGKPIVESKNGDIPRAVLNFRFFSGYPKSLAQDSYSDEPTEHHFVTREPLGVVGLITPWNLPLYLATWKIAPALAMGNTLVLKPAEWTPYTATLFAEVCQKAGLPEGVFNVVHGYGANPQHNAAGESLTTHPDVKAISFTGETGTGKAIMKAASDTLKKVSFELGGKGANILFEDADLESAIPTAVHSAFRNQGQVCLAGSRLFVHETIYDDVVSRVTEHVNKIKVGDPQDESTTMGAMISCEQFDKVNEYIELGKAEGTLLCGGSSPQECDENGLFIEPTLFTDLPNNSRLLSEEIFGPVLPIIKFSDEDELIKEVNSTNYGLSCSIWSENVNRCHRVSKALKMGMVWVNCWFARDLRTPFGGMKQSGLGREGGRYVLEFFSEPKTISYRYK